MKYRILCSAVALAAALGAYGCTVKSAETPAAAEVLAAESQTTDYSYDESECVKITLSGNSASADGAGVLIDGSSVTITDAGAYIVSGELYDGQIIVDAEKTDIVRIILNNAVIKNSASAAINSIQAKETIITLAENSENSLSDADEYVYADLSLDEPDAALFSKDNLTINGAGALTVAGNYKHGICTKDDLVVTGGQITVTAENDALKGRDSVWITGGSFDITSRQDGIKANNDEDSSKGHVTIDGGEFNINAADDGIHAETALVINGGDINIPTSYEGIEGATVTVAGGSINITSSDDGINAAGGTDAAGGSMQAGDSFGALSEYYIKFTGGSVTINAEGDGIDANGNIYMEGGVVIVNGSVSGGNGALDYDGSFQISGGALIAAGSSAMARNASDSSTQPSVMFSYSETQAAGTLAALTDAGGGLIAAYAPSKEYSSIVISAPYLHQGEAYSLYSGGEAEGSGENGLFMQTGYTEGEKLCDISLSGIISSFMNDGSEAAGMGTMRGGGMRGGGMPAGERPTGERRQRTDGEGLESVTPPTPSEREAAPERPVGGNPPTPPEAGTPE